MKVEFLYVIAELAYIHLEILCDLCEFAVLENKGVFLPCNVLQILNEDLCLLRLTQRVDI